MFRASIAAQRLKECVSALRALVLEAKFTLKPGGISVCAIDPANVAAVSLELPGGAFESYEASDGEIGLDLQKLDDIISLSPKDGMLDLVLDENSRRLVVKSARLTYTASLLDPSSIRKGPKVPELHLPGLVKLHGDRLRRGLKASEKVSDYVSVGISGDTFFIEGQGDVDSVRFELDNSDVIELRRADVESMFSIEYLLDISKIAGSASEVTVEIGKDYPMRLTFALAEGHGEVVYMIAPRVEND